MCFPLSSCSLPAAPGWLAAWDLHKNWHEVFTLKTRAGEFACFDSLKAISAAWVVFYHVILWQIWFINNPEVRHTGHGHCTGQRRKAWRTEGSVSSLAVDD